nr:efflux RND transporter periplasmic adaptor subunit [Wenzhouxiangella sp. XN24]
MPGCEQPGAPEPAQASQAVSVVRAEAVETAVTSVVPGIVRPVRRARMSTRQAGHVDRVLVKAGDAVAAGQEILRVDARDLEAAREAAMRQLEAAREAREQAVLNRERFRRLYARSLVAKVQLEERELQAERAAGVLERARAELESIEINLDYAVIQAPFDGVVSEVLAETGTFAAPGVPLVILEDRSQLEVDAGIDQEAAARVTPGDRLQMRVVGHDGAVSGRVVAVLSALRDTGVGLRLRLAIESPPAGISPGMVAEIRLPAGEPAAQAVSVPAEAVLRRGQLDGLFVVAEDDAGQLRAQLRWISLATGRDLAERVVVTRGLRAGERVVIGDAVGQLADAQAVTVAR